MFCKRGFFSLIGTMLTASAYQHPGRKKQRRGILRSTCGVEKMKEKFIELRPFNFITFSELNANVYFFIIYSTFIQQNVFKNLLLFELKVF